MSTGDRGWEWSATAGAPRLANVREIGLHLFEGGAKTPYVKLNFTQTLDLLVIVYPL